MIKNNNKNKSYLIIIKNSKNIIYKLMIMILYINKNIIVTKILIF